MYEDISEYNSFALIGRDFSAFDADFSVLGFANSTDKTELVVLKYNSVDEDTCCEDVTLRESIILEKKETSNLSDEFGGITVDGQRFDFDSACGETLDCCDFSNVYVISEFIKLGWKSNRFFDAPLDSLMIYFIELENKIDDLTSLDLSKKIEVVFSKFEKTDYPFVKLNLEVGMEVDIPIELFDGEEQIVIKNLKLLNLAECPETNEFFQEDVILPYVEYLGNNELSLTFCLSDELDKPFKGMGGLAVDDGVVALAIDVPNENNLNSTLIYSPIKPNTKHIECQLVRCEKMLDEPVEYRFSI